jgi:hypothetical protein
MPRVVVQSRQGPSSVDAHLAPMHRRVLEQEHCRVGDIGHLDQMARGRSALHGFERLRLRRPERAVARDAGEISATSVLTSPSTAAFTVVTVVEPG